MAVDADQYGLDNWCEVLQQPVPSPEFTLRRAIAEELAGLSEQLLRVEAPPATLADVLARVKALREDMPVLPKQQAAASSSAMVAGQATARDVLMLFDYDPQIGQSNPVAPRLCFADTPDQVVAHTTLSELHQGAPGRAHGGVLAGVLDVVLARVQHRAGFFGVTGQLSVRYLKPTLIGEPLELRAWSERVPGRVTRVLGGVWMRGEQTVSAQGFWVAPKNT